MTTNLLSTDTGRQTLARIACYLGRDRMSKHFERSFYRAFDAWRTAEALTPGSGYFDLETLLNDLNGVTQDEIAYINTLLGHLGCLEGQSVADTTIYVDSVNGSDVTGDGSVSKPYESISFLTSGLFPRHINHAYTIAFLSDYNVNGDLIFDVDFGPNGSLSLIGVGEPIVIDGPYEILSEGLLDANVGRFFQMTTSISGNPTGEFLMVIDGPDEGYAQAIHSLEPPDTLLTINGSFLNVTTGNHVNIVHPPITLTVDRVSFQCRNTNGYSTQAKLGAKVAIYNLRIEITDLAANSKSDCILIDNSCVQQMSFCQIIPPTTSGSMRISQRAELNTLCGPSEAANLAATTVTNLNEYTQLFDIAGVVIDNVGTLPLYVEGYGKYISSSGVFYMWKTGNLEEISCRYIAAQNCVGKILVALIRGNIDSDTGGAVELENSSLYIEDLSAITSDNVISILSNSSLALKDVGAETSYGSISGFGIYFLGVGRVELQDAAGRLVGLTSPNGINLSTVSPAVTSAIPAAYGWTSDSQGSFVKRLGV